MEAKRQRMDLAVGHKRVPIHPRPQEVKGFTLIEALIAVLILTFGLLATAQVLAICLLINKNNGRDTSKTVTFAHDKMDELNSLGFTDTTTNLTVDPPYPPNGVGLTAGGSIAPAAPVAGYADFLDDGGSRTTQGNAAFTRQWQIINDAANLKRIMVSVTSDKSFQYGTPPKTTTVTYKGQ